jgi:hypothetical protein
LTFAVEGLEVVKTTLAGNLALKLFEPVEGHARGISSMEGRMFKRE